MFSKRFKSFCIGHKNVFISFSRFKVAFILCKHWKHVFFITEKHETMITNIILKNTFLVKWIIFVRGYHELDVFASTFPREKKENEKEKKFQMNISR